MFILRLTYWKTRSRFSSIFLNSSNDSALHDSNVIGKPEVSDVLAVDIDAKYFPFQEFESIFDCIGKEIRRNYVSLLHTSLNWIVYMVGSSSTRTDIVAFLFYTIFQHLDIPIVDVMWHRCRACSTVHFSVNIYNGVIPLSPTNRSGKRCYLRIWRRK